MDEASRPRDMTFIHRGHLGGFVRTDRVYWPHGDPMTYTPRLWDWLAERFAPRVVWDIGCAEGHAVKHFLARGIRAWGVDGCVDALDTAVAPRDRIIIHDYTRGPLQVPARIEPPDLVYSCEFVEHVEQRCMENFLADFDRARTVCFTHAFVDQPGHHHVNCQAPPYWIAVMQRRGFAWDEEASLESRRIAGQSHWERSGLVFTRRPR